MSLLGLLPQTVTVVRYDDAAEDAYGNATRAETTRTDVAARLEQIYSAETTLGQDTVSDKWRLFLPPDVIIDAGDEIEETGRRFRLDGTPARVHGASTVHHIEAVLLYVGDVA